MQLYQAKKPIVPFDPLLNILEILTITNVYRLHALKFVLAWHKGILPELFHHFSSMSAKYIVITPGMRAIKIFSNFEKKYVKNKYWQTNDLIYGH